MCIFSSQVQSVGATRIFVADLGRGVHATAYQMDFLASEPVAMILPVPVLKGTGDEALAFVSLGGYVRFFNDLDRCFPEPEAWRKGSYGLSAPILASILAVHEVGDFEASYVPSIADFPRLDPRFRLPESAWETLPDYHDFGFAVFQLRPGPKLRRVHPIAYRYPAERPEALFFPTVHVHDGGGAEPEALFAHNLYAQGPWPVKGLGWEVGVQPGRVMDPARSQGLIAPDVPVQRAQLYGFYPNADILALGGSGGMRAEAVPARACSGVGDRLGWQDFTARRRRYGTY